MKEARTSEFVLEDENDPDRTHRFRILNGVPPTQKSVKGDRFIFIGVFSLSILKESE